MSPMCVSRVEDEWEMVGMTMGMNRDGTMWAQDEHECGMNVMQPCIAMHDRWSHTGEIVMDNILLIQALHLANGAIARSLDTSVTTVGWALAELESLEYSDRGAKETLRLQPVAIGQDLNVWTDTEKSFPKRFIGSSIDLRGCNFELIPFGSDRREYPGNVVKILHVGLMKLKAS
ncbi:Cytochrome P450 71B28 [Vitis vinifera]|uniref:Cytochrome P450 71B28 n=1 Tax=Vitis vinifera TaxID=29760 RepID=A0A438JHE6_VITVI|nr:Cytochrome P450 71B28 [Vitis vinifera]